MSCASLQQGDTPGAALAIGQALDLERQARPLGIDAEEVADAVRPIIADLLAADAAVKRVQGDKAGAEEAALAARRVNVTARVSNRKLLMAITPIYRTEEGALLGLDSKETARLQRWYSGLLSLDEQQGASVPRAARVRVDHLARDGAFGPESHGM